MYMVFIKARCTKAKWINMAHNQLTSMSFVAQMSNLTGMLNIKLLKLHLIQF